MRVRVGTSGFSYKAWKGSFYPGDLVESKMLAFYASRFDTCEINNTFYRMPKTALLEAWAREVSPACPDFAFALKAPVYLTFLKKGPLLAEPAKAFFAAAGGLGDRLGPVLFQLPVGLTKDLALLDAFFAFVPGGVRLAVEAPHPSWHDAETFALLRSRGAALCAVDDLKGGSPLVATADFGYVRLRTTKYGPRALAAWAAAVRAQPWREAYVFFKHEDEATGPRLGEAFKRALSPLPARRKSS